MRIDGPLMVELKTDPLAFMLTTPDGGRYALPLSPLAAQSLGMALLANCGSTELLPELRDAIEAETALRRMGGNAYAN